MSNILKIMYGEKTVNKLVKNGREVYKTLGVTSDTFTITNSSGRTTLTNSTGIDIERPPLVDM